MKILYYEKYLVCVLTEEDQQLKVNTDYPANICLFKVNNGNSRKR